MDKGEWNPSISRDIHSQDLMSLLDDKTANKIVQNIKKNIPKDTVTYQGKYSGKPANPRQKSQDSDLLSSMAQKLSKVEKICEAQRKEIKEKSELLQKAQKEIETLKKISSDESVVAFKNLEDENSRLRKQVQEMEAFLADYGLKWVGNSPDGQLDINSLMQDLPKSDPLYRYNLPNEIDITVIERRIHELNIVAEKDAARWVSQGSVHRFKAPESICITFFKNGLIMQGYPFRPYSSKEAQSLLSDILDGYFPYDLKKKYPDGVPLRSVDRSSEMFKAGSNLQGVNDPSLGLLNKDQFLAQLPENIIKNGEIIPVREDIAKVFSSEKTGTVKIETHVDVLLKSQPDFKDFTTLRIKTETGKRNLIILMRTSDTLQDLLKFLEPNREGKGRFEIRSTFPAKTFDLLDKRSLLQLDLVPNYALALRSLD
jgi:hypothetical protein